MLEKGHNPSTGKPVIASWDKLQCLARGMEMNVIDLINQADDVEVQDALDGATPGDRLSNYMLIKNDDAESVADLLAITPEDVHRIISGDLDISDAQAEALASRYKTSPDVFREGMQDYIKLPSNVRPISVFEESDNAEETELVSIYRNLNSIGQSALIGTARGLAANPDMKKGSKSDTETTA
jgi:plasmid maintenance system antidote protein VapI